MADNYIKGSGTGRGGWRGGGRPKGTLTGTKTDKTETFTQRITPEEKEYLKKCLIEFRNKNNEV